MTRPSILVLLYVALAVAAIIPTYAQSPVESQAALRNVPLEDVDLAGIFWGPRLQTHYETTIPHTLNRLEEEGHVTNFDLAAGLIEGDYRGNHAYDSDLYKGLEGAIYTLFHVDDPELLERVEGIVERIIAGQEQDGYLGTHFTVTAPDQKFTNMRTWHELYNMGHFIEMAVAHHQLTGNRNALDAAIRLADFLDRTFGPGKRYETPGHQELELALVKLYLATGERRYLELSRFFLDERGHLHGMERRPFVPEDQPTIEDWTMTVRELRIPDRIAVHFIRNGRMQDHMPLADQREAKGHAVRAGYTYCAMTDVVGLMDAPEFAVTLDSLWDDILNRKMYITGNVGSAQYHDEGFGDPYGLPNDNAYCETCAAVAFVLWQHRMNLLRGDACYADVLELSLYNGGLSGVSLAGDSVFYRNPLASQNGGNRSGWIIPACCPTNVARFIPQVGGLQYAQSDDGVYVNLYATSDATIDVGETPVRFKQETNYPWDGSIEMTINPDAPVDFLLALRIPTWTQGRPTAGELYHFAKDVPTPITLKVNGESHVVQPDELGYVHLQQQWKAGDQVQLDFAMPIRRVVADTRVESCAGQVALMRGPVVYCVEGIDNLDIDLFSITLPSNSELAAQYQPELLDGVVTIQATALTEQGVQTLLTAIPYYAWNNREKGPMTVWINAAP